MTKDNAPHRAPNFTPKEVETLIYHLELKPELINPAARLNRDGVKMVKSSIVLTVNEKLELWEEVAAEINKVGESSLTGIVRSATDVKRKWDDLKSRVKNKAEDIRTGKLPNKTPLSPLEERVLYLIAKTSHLQGLNGALPPAYLNVIDRKKQDRLSSSSSEQVLNGDGAEPSVDVEANTIETDADDISVKEERVHPPSSSVPAVSRIPIITFTSLSKIMRTPPKARINNDLETDSNSKKSAKTGSNGSKDCDSKEMMEMIYSSQKELKNEIKSIKKIMIRISEQKRRRIEQESEKIQLKKMKLMLKCQKQGVDYDEFITEFM